MAGGNTRCARQPEREASGYQRHHQVAGSNPLRDQRLHFGAAQHSTDVLCMAFTNLWIAQNQRIAQQLVQRNTFVRQQRVPRWHRHHQRIAPDGQGDDAIARLVGLC